MPTHAHVFTDDEQVDRLQVSASPSAGYGYFLGSDVPTDPNQIVRVRLTNDGSANLLVNGASAPKVFTLLADPDVDIKLYEIRLLLAADNILFDGASFGSRPALANGLKIDVTVNDGLAAEIANAKRNEELALWASHPRQNLHLDLAGPKDWLIVSFAIGGAWKLVRGSADSVGVTVRDNLTHVSYKFFAVQVLGVKV